MKHPRMIDRFLSDGFPVPSDAPDTIALPKSIALEMIREMEGTKLAIRVIDIWQMESGCPLPTEEEWSCPRLPLEAASDYASRSRRAAVTFINSRQDDSKAIFAVAIDDQQEAA